MKRIMIGYIEVSEMSDPRYEILVAIHELVEKVLCDHKGITEQQVDEFDKKFEDEYISSCYPDLPEYVEPGNDSKAPYHRQHKIADIVERIVANELDVNWDEYGKEIKSF